MIQIAVMGLGTVGTGVCKLINENQEQIANGLGEPLSVKTILVRHFKDGSFRHLMTDDFSQIEHDPNIRAVVETIGGVTAAYEYTKRALSAGKHVVTANKQLVAEHGCELLRLARQRNVRYLFEASVGGGIPIIRPMTDCLQANRIDEVYGILNGTTNYIITRMFQVGISFDDALREAQEKGYAEADPTADIEGIDVVRKLCILADLAFGQETRPAEVPVEGISNLSQQDVRIAERNGYQIRLLGRAVRLDGNHRTAYVSPHLIPKTHPMANVVEVNNAIMVRGNAVGETMFYGRGAGALPTASACVSDLMDALSANPWKQQPVWTSGGNHLADPLTLSSRYYFRVTDSPAEAEAAFGKAEVLFHGNGETAFLTEPVSGLEARTRAAALQTLSCMRVL